MANRTERRIRRQEKKYTKATKKYTEKTGDAPFEAFYSGKSGKKVRRISKRLGKLYKKPLFAKKPARKNPNPIVRKKKDITVTSKKPPANLPGGAIVGPGAKNPLGNPYPISTPVSVKSISKPANRAKRAATALIKSIDFAAEGKHKKAEKWKTRHNKLTTIKLYDKPLFSKKPAKKGKSCPAPRPTPTSNTGRRKKRDWKSCKTFGQKVGHVFKQIPKVLIPVGVGIALAKGLKKKK